MTLRKRGAAIFAAFLFGLLAVPSLAQDVSLTSHDGTVKLDGRLLSYDGAFYRLDTVYGTLTVDGQGVVCAGADCPDPDNYVAEVRISGARKMGEVLMPALVEAYGASMGLRVKRLGSGEAEFAYELRDRTDKRLKARVFFRVSTTDEGFADLVAEEADLTMALREPRRDEVSRGVEAGIGDLTRPQRARIVALDALVPVVSPLNPVRSMTLDELRRVLAGELTDWAELGGTPGLISLHSPARSSGVQSVLERLVLAGAKAAEGEAHGTNFALTEAVIKAPLALGFSALSELGNTRVVQVVGPCGRLVRANARTLKTEDYPLTTPLFLYAPARRFPQFTRGFLDWLSSAQAQRVVQRAGFVDQGPETIPMTLQGDRLANAIRAAGEETDLAALQSLISDLGGGARLTTTFRFRGGSVRMDPQSEGNIDLLAQALNAGLYDGRTLIFAGFSDGQGPATGNQKISRRRAQAVYDAVRAAARDTDWAGIDVKVRGYGEALPMGCDEVDWGRKINRRVEIWLR